MTEGSNFNIGADFGGLAEVPPPTPEKIVDDDDDDLEEAPAPKTLLEYLKKDTVDEAVEDSSAKSEAKDPDAEKENDQDDEPDSELDQQEYVKTTDNLEENSDVAEMTSEEEQEASTAILENRQQEIHQEVETAPDDHKKGDANYNYTSIL